MLRWLVFKKILKYRRIIRSLKRDKSKLQRSVERLEHQLRLSRLEEKRLKERLIINDFQRK